MNKINSLTQYIVYIYKCNILYIVYKIIKLIGGIALIKQFLKRLFCKHEWEEIEGSRHMIHGGMSTGANFKCNKCGKVIWSDIFARTVNK